jgi:hypothetical protein
MSAQAAPGNYLVLFLQDRWAFLNRQFAQGYPLLLTPVGEQAPTGSAREFFNPSGFQAGQDL